MNRPINFVGQWFFPSNLMKSRLCLSVSLNRLTTRFLKRSSVNSEPKKRPEDLYDGTTIIFTEKNDFSRVSGIELLFCPSRQLMKRGKFRKYAHSKLASRLSNCRKDSRRELLGRLQFRWYLFSKILSRKGGRTRCHPFRVEYRLALMILTSSHLLLEIRTFLTIGTGD